MLPLLYSFRRCPYAMRARLCLWMARVPVLVYEILLKDKPQEFLALSPKGTVPVLSINNGKLVLDESLDIMAYAVDNAEHSLFLKDNRNHYFISKNDDEFKPLLDKYKYYVYNEHSQQEARSCCVEAFILELEECLKEQQFLDGSCESFADLAIFPFIRQFANVEPQWFASTFPKLSTWLCYWQNSEAFQAIMKKLPLASPTPLL